VKSLQIRWQRLVDASNQTCGRCGATGAAVERAVELLKRALRELEIEVALKTEALDPATFAKDPLESNRIWIGGLPLEWWLSATSGKSQCCDACGDADCRTVTVDGRTYEATPAELIVKAGLLAAARLLGTDPPEGRSDPGAAPAQGPGRVLPTSQCGCGA
jgi:hypothetical protein